MQDDLIKVRGVCLANSSYLRDYFDLHKTPVYLNSNVKEIKENEVIILNNGKEETIKANRVILSVGYKPDPLVKKGKHVHLVGDCLNVGNLKTVIWKAWDVATKL